MEKGLYEEITMIPDSDFTRIVHFPSTETLMEVDDIRSYGFAYLRVDGDVDLIWETYAGPFTYIYGVYLGVMHMVEELSTGGSIYVFYELDDNFRPVRLMSSVILPELMRKTLHLFFHHIYFLTIDESEFGCVKTFTKKPIPPVPDTFEIHNFKMYKPFTDG